MYKTYVKMFTLLIFMSFIAIFPSALGEEKFFRADYRYVEPLKHYFKVHTTHSTWSYANQICSTEGTNLFYPKSVDEVLEFIQLLSILNGTQSSDFVLNGLTNLLSEGLTGSFDGIPLSELYSNWEPTSNESNKYPFICKKSYDSVVWNDNCYLPLLDYTYSSETKRCYKFHLEPKNWTDAFFTCNGEQSYLAIINSESEATVLKKITENMPKEGIMGNYVSGIAHLGFLNENNRGWKTIEGVNLEDSGYSLWNAGQPDGPRDSRLELCGSMFYNGELNDIGCQVRAFFICEHEIDTWSSLRGQRLDKAQKIIKFLKSVV